MPKPKRVTLAYPTPVARQLVLGRHENNTRSNRVPNKKRMANRLACRRAQEG